MPSDISLAVGDGARRMTIGQRCRQDPRLPQAVESVAAANCGQGGRRITAAGPSQRLGDLFVRRRAGGRPRALRGREPAI